MCHKRTSGQPRGVTPVPSSPCLHEHPAGSISNCLVRWNSAPWGLAIVKALLVAKFISLAQAGRIRERYRIKSLIWATLYKSAIFLFVVWVLTVIEEAIVASLHGQSILEAIAGIGGGTPLQVIATIVLVFFIFFPYFAIGSLGEVMGKRALFRLFFVERREFWAIEPTIKQS